VLEYSERRIGLYAAERELLGCSHAQVAAYLFGLWGLPSTIVEAVAWHHEPAGSLSAKFSPLAAVHVASAYHDEKSSSRLRDRTPVDAAFLAGIGCAERGGANSRWRWLSSMAKRCIMAEKILLVDDDTTSLTAIGAAWAASF
jgi:hypothetical protein